MSENNDTLKKELSDQIEHGDRVFRALQKAGIKVSTALIGGWCPGDPEPEFVIENPETKKVERLRTDMEMIIQMANDHFLRPRPLRVKMAGLAKNALAATEPETP